MITMSRAFVIQLHSIGNSSHFDLMIEDGEKLATWQLAALPGSGEALPARLLPPHRREYLTYQGPVSGDRGSVQIADSGSAQMLSQGPDLWEIELAGRSVSGRFQLRRVHADNWELVPVPGGAV